MKRVLTIILCILFSISLNAGEEQDRKTIKKLISLIRESQATLIRNGDSHTAEEAAEHLEGKWKRARSLLWFKTRADEFTPRQFITHIASKSSFSGDPYQVKLKNGKKIPTENWLTEKLDKIQNSRSNKKQNEQKNQKSH